MKFRIGITDKTNVLAEWEGYFRELSTSSYQSIPQITEATAKIPELEALLVIWC